MTNPFEAMCRRASAERWCWNLGCTTCGQQDFRYGLVQIGRARHPGSQEWDAFYTRERDDQEVNSIRWFRSWPEPMRLQLLDILAAASLENLARECASPDWLGYLGVALDFTQEDEVVSKRLTDSWLPQLSSMVHPGSASRRRLGDIRASGRPLTWMDLDGLERNASSE